MATDVVSMEFREYGCHCTRPREGSKWKTYLLAWEMGAWCWKRQEDASWCGGDWACAEKLVDQSLCAIAGSGSKVVFDVWGVELERVWVDGHEVAQIKGVWGWLLNHDGEAGAFFDFGHNVYLPSIIREEGCCCL